MCYCGLFSLFVFLDCGVCFGCGGKVSKGKFHIGTPEWKEATKNRPVSCHVIPFKNATNHILEAVPFIVFVFPIAPVQGFP